MGLIMDIKLVQCHMKEAVISKWWLIVSKLQIVWVKGIRRPV
jgi:hypothetical protein